MSDKRSESQFKDESAQTTRHIVKQFPTLLNARSLDKLNKEEGYEFPISGDELAKYKDRKGKK